MITNRILKLRRLKPLLPLLKLNHTPTCPTKHKKTDGSISGDDVPKGGMSKGMVGSVSERRILGPKRLLKSSTVRMAFLPEEWFLFFYNKTGVSGPYLLCLGLGNYLFSKEIYVMDHEYFVGISILLMVFYVNMKHGPELAKWLDDEIDAHAKNWGMIRQDEKNFYLTIIDEAKDSQWRAEGQKLLMDAKKENISMQLEATYRERIKQLHRVVKGRLDYQIRVQRSLSKIQRKWISQYIIDNVMKDITTEFKEEFFENALEIISHLAHQQ